MEKIIIWTENLISGTLPFMFLLLSGIYLTFKSGFFQFRFFLRSVSYAIGGMFGKKTDSAVSPFEAACTALSATVGTGNIAGVAGAVSLGGAGAVFWMWISAAAGMCIKSAEILLALKYREKKDGAYCGGPMYYIKMGLPKTFLPLSYLFSLIGIFAVVCSGNLTQTNAAANSCNDSVKPVIGIVFTVITALVLVGGMKRIGSFSGKIVPFMAVVYIFMSFGILFANIDFLPSAFKMIFYGAFNPKAVTGGIIGSAMNAAVTGASRGIFSNEAGLGTSAMAHAAAEKTDGPIQSLYGIFEVFADTIVLCTLTALTILCSGINIEYGKIASTQLVQAALSKLYGSSAHILIAVMMCLFGLSSVIGWGLYGLTCTGFIFGKPGKKVFLTFYPLFCLAGALCRVETAWRLSAFFNGIMLCINIFAVLLLKHDVFNEMSQMKKEGKINAKNRKSEKLLEKRRSGSH